MIRLASRVDAGAAADGLLDGVAGPPAMQPQVARLDVGFGGTDAEAQVRSALTTLARREENSSIVLELVDSQASGRPAPLAIGDWLSSLADAAADANAVLAVVNGNTLRTAADLWHVLERVGHPAVGCCWDLEAGLRHAQPPTVAVPTLGTRIVSALLASSDTPARQLIQRLRGIGFDGWITVADAVRLDPQAVARLREWIAPKTPAKPAKKPGAAASAKATVS